ncbi:MAG: CpaF family protein [Gaiellales bacterium]
MSLTERLSSHNGGPNGAAEHDEFADVRRRVHQVVIETLGTGLLSGESDDAAITHQLRAIVDSALADEHVPLSRADRENLAREIADEVNGYGPLERFLKDDTVTEIMVNNHREIFIERGGRIFPTEARFADDAHLRRILDKIVAQVGRRIDESSAMVDARLPDGSRVNAIIPPLSLHGPAMTIRKFSQRRLAMSDLVGLGALSDEMGEFLGLCVAARLNVLVSGGTGSGKTTMLNVLSGYIPDDERIITIEDAAELKLDQRHWLRLEARPANVEGTGEVSIRDLLRNALRMRPDRIVVGEVRGAEALDMLQAMNTGHDGSLSTVHCNSPRDAISRLETMVLMAGFELPVRAIREQVSSALHLIVHLERLHDGSRKVVRIAEVQRMEGDQVTLQDLFTFQVRGVTSNGSVDGQLEPTGLHPTFRDEFRRRGLDLPADLFRMS